MWIIENADATKGKIKWNEKNRVKVALSTENPPQIHCTRSVPINGIAENKLVITANPTISLNVK